MRKHKLAVISTHPIQYYAPLFKLLNGLPNISLRVFYTIGNPGAAQYDEGFKKTIRWNIDVLNGYDIFWAVNTAKHPGSAKFNGIINPHLPEQIAAWQPDAILIFGWAYISHLRALIHFKNKVPVLFRGDSTLLDERSGLKSIIKSFFKNWVYKHVDYALYTGSGNKAYFLKFGLKDSQLIFTPHAVDNERFAIPRTEAVSRIRSGLGIGMNETLILFAGKFESKKDPFILLHAFRKIEQDNVKLLFVGNGHLEKQLKEEAEKDDRVCFLDFQNQNEMPAIYQSCDIFCLPSQGPGETWGLAVNEAMACGKAVLLSDKVGCCIDLVIPGQNGLIFASGDMPDLIQKLETLLISGKNGLAEMGKRSEVIIRDWNFTEQVNSITRLLDGK